MQAALYKSVHGQNYVPSEDVHLIVPGFCKNGTFHGQRVFADGKSVLSYQAGPSVTSRVLMRERMQTTVQRQDMRNKEKIS